MWGMSTSPASEVNAYAPPQADTTVAPVLPSLVSEDAPPNVKVAGWLMIVNAALVLISRIILPMTVPVGFLPAIIDLLIGSSLARGKTSLRLWALIRCVGGVVLSGVFLLPHDQYLEFGVAVAACGSLFALLLGRARMPRIVICCVVFGLYLIVNLIGLVALAGAASVLR